MPSINDVYNELVNANNTLQEIHNDTVAATTATNNVRNAVDQGLAHVVNTLNAGFVNLAQGMGALITIQEYANQALAHHSAQFDTMICDLQQISQHTCALVTEAHIQTRLQTQMSASVGMLAEFAKTEHPDAALEFDRLKALRDQIERCCPPREEPPACTFQACDAPRPIGEPPRPKYDPYKAPDQPQPPR